MQYALNIPKTSFILFGAIPRPVHAPAAVVLEDVTYGYDPKSISNKVPCAPSASIFLPAFYLLIYVVLTVNVFKFFNISRL